MTKVLKNILTFLLSIPVRFYRFAISPWLRPSCRHLPSCSEYMLDALKLHGPFTGLTLGVDRILRCRPGGTHGFDPVPRFLFRRYRPVTGFFKRYKTENRLRR